ncbi:MAG TPA: hypothetical protein VEB68_07800 [Croceibacterium sp.]|nr:hypothetical protein [Croceibacterium sp.]
MAAEHLYSCFDFRLRSELALELTAASDDGEREVVTIRRGPVPEMLPGAGPQERGIQVAGDAVLLTVEGVARYLVTGGREIVVDQVPGGSDRNLRLFMLGSALGILSHQRGLLPLHANAVVARGGAYAFAGDSGAGKSTLAAHFARAGYEVLCDDVCVVSFAADGTPLAWPGLPRLKLWGDAALAFGHDSASLERAIEGLDKYHVPLPPAGDPRPVPFRRLYLLTRADDGEDTAFTRLSGHRAMAAAMAQTYRDIYVRPMGLAAQNFRQCALLLAGAEVWQARRAWGYAVFEREAALLERHILDGG